MTAPEQAYNVVQFPRDLKPAHLCAQCSIPMAVIRGEPEPNEPAAIAVTYRCAQCGMRPDRAQNDEVDSVNGEANRAAVRLGAGTAGLVLNVNACASEHPGRTSPRGGPLPIKRLQVPLEPRKSDRRQA
jgi:hypothetical protein